MAGSRGKGSRDRSGVPREDWLHLLRVALVVLAVAGTLVLGAALQVDPSSPGPDAPLVDAAPGGPGMPALTATPAEPNVHSGDERPEATRTVRAVVAAEPSPDEPAVPPGTASDLDRRAGADRRRLSSEENAWALQLMAACDPANVERTVRSVGDDARLHVLPARIQGRDCYRLCWGPFTTRSAAEAARGRLPSSVRSLPGTPQPRQVAELL